MTVTIYHNPECGTSRNVLALLQAAGVELKVIQYLRSPPDRSTLKAMIAASGIPVRDVLRVKGTPYHDLGLDNPKWTDAQLIDHMLAHPILINRPFVVTARGTQLCRPSDRVLDLLESVPQRSFDKEEGVPFLRDTAIVGEDPGMLATLATADLPTDDLSEPGRRFWEYRTLDGHVAGYGGFERYGGDVLVRSIIVPHAQRRQGGGRNLLALLLRRAFDDGARTAWLLTQTAVPFFVRAGFQAISRDTAPATILATRQASELCPQSATVMKRAVSL
jgi:arsenate reductase